MFTDEDAVQVPEKERSGKFYFKNIFRKVFVEDWMMKLIALVITFGLWLGVTGLSEPMTRVYRSVPLTFGFSNETVVTNSPIEEVDLVLTGDRRRLEQLNRNELAVSIDLTTVPPGDRIIQLDPERVSISLPTGIKLDEIRPNKISVKLEAVEEKEVPVAVRSDGDIPEGHEIYEQTASPARVSVRGPASYIRTLDSVSTEEIALQGRTGTFVVTQVPVTVSNSLSNALETIVDVTFRIGEKRAERLYLVEVADDPFADRATVVLFGPRSVFDGVTAADLSVRLTRDANGNSQPQVVLPEVLQGKVEVRVVKLN